MKYYICIIICLSCLLPVGYGQRLIESIPFEYTDNSWMFVKIKVSDSIEGNFMFDTGAMLPILDRGFVERNGIKTADGSSVVKGIGDGKQQTSGFIFQLKFAAGKYSRLTKAVMVMDLRKHVNRDGVDGIFNTNFFDNRAVEFDFDNNKINVYTVGSYRPLENGYQPTAITTNMNQGRIFHKTEVFVKGAPVSESFTFDTGSAGGMSIGERAAKNIDMEAIPMLAENESFDNGLGGGKSIRTIINIDSIKLDGKTIMHPYSLYSKYPKYEISWIGMGIISKFNWFFDFKNKKYYMKPSKNYGEVNDSIISYRNIVFNTDGKGHFFVRRILRCASCLTDIDAGNTVLHAKDSSGDNIPLPELVNNSRKWLDKSISLTFLRNDEEITKSIVIENVSLPCNK